MPVLLSSITFPERVPFDTWKPRLAPRTSQFWTCAFPALIPVPSRGPAVLSTLQSLSSAVPLVEIERGALTNVMPIRSVRPVTDYLELQGRFRHLFADDPRAQEERDHLQALADYNIQVYGLKGQEPDIADTSGTAAVGRGGHAAGRV